MTRRHIGTVTTFNNLKGIGSLACPGHAAVFCHYTAIRRSEYLTLMRGEIVAFDIVEGGHGEEADNVTVLQDTSDVTG